MTLTAFLHGYPPQWSMGGETSTHRTIRTIEGSVVFSGTAPEEYDLDGVTVRPLLYENVNDIVLDAKSVDADILFAHSSLSKNTVSAAKKMRIPSILAVHAPPRFGQDLRRAWISATARLYNTETARKDWKDPTGLILHPPAGGPPATVATGPHDALTLTSSLLNKGVSQVLTLAARWPGRRFIIVESPAHSTHGSEDFFNQASALPNVEVWSRLHPDEMYRLWAETGVLLVPSRYETYGLSAVEAAWHGIPSAHVDTPHVREGIGRASRLLVTQDVSELASAVREIERDYARWSAMAYSRAYELHVREYRELEKFAARVEALTLR